MYVVCELVLMKLKRVVYDVLRMWQDVVELFCHSACLPMLLAICSVEIVNTVSCDPQVITGELSELHFKELVGGEKFTQMCSPFLIVGA